MRTAAGAYVDGVLLTVIDGPALRRQPGDEPGIATIGQEVVLLDKDARALDWQASWDQPMTARVTGVWDVDRRYASWRGQRLTLEHRDRPAGARDEYSVLCARSIEQIERPARSTTRPATTRSDAIELVAKLVSADRIDLSWTARQGASKYLIELSEDGADYHESMDVEGTETSASLVGFEMAQSGQTLYIRVAAVDARGRRMVESNVRVITPPER